MNNDFGDLVMQLSVVDNEELTELNGAIQPDVDRPRLHMGGD